MNANKTPGCFSGLIRCFKPVEKQGGDMQSEVNRITEKIARGDKFDLDRECKHTASKLRKRYGAAEALRQAEEVTSKYRGAKVGTINVNGTNILVTYR